MLLESAMAEKRHRFMSISLDRGSQYSGPGSFISDHDRLSAGMCSYLVHGHTELHLLGAARKNEPNWLVSRWPN